MSQEGKGKIEQVWETPDDPAARARLRKHNTLVQIAALLGRPLEDFFKAEDKNQELPPPSGEPGSDND